MRRWGRALKHLFWRWEKKVCCEIMRTCEQRREDEYRNKPKEDSIRFDYSLEKEKNKLN